MVQLAVHLIKSLIWFSSINLFDQVISDQVTEMMNIFNPLAKFPIYNTFRIPKQLILTYFSHLEMCLK